MKVVVDWLVGWSLRSLFCTNTATSETAESRGCHEMLTEDTLVGSLLYRTDASYLPSQLSSSMPSSDTTQITSVSGTAATVL